MVVNKMAPNDLATEGAKASAAIIFTQYFYNITVSVPVPPEGLTTAV